MLRWVVVGAAVYTATALYGFVGEFTFFKGIAQLVSYFLMVATLVVFAIVILRGKGE